MAEDDLALAEQIKTSLGSDGHRIDVIHDGEEAEFMGSTEPYDLIVLDLGLPIRDGISVLKCWRNDGIETPVLILTARDGWTDRVDGLDAGADDYLTKPFHMQELSARVRAILRRKAGQSNPLFQSLDVAFDTRTGRVTRNGAPVTLTSQETAVLSYLIHNVGRYVSRTELSEHIYEYDDDRDSNTIAVFVTRLRKKLGDEFIQTMRGSGYCVTEP